MKEHQKEGEDITHTIAEDMKIDTLNGRGLQKDEAFFQAYDVKETVSEKSAYDSSEKDDIQDRKEIAERLSKTIFSYQNNKEKDDEKEDDEEEEEEENDE